MSVLLFFAVLFVLVLVHEWGHYITAKKTGMRVDEFGIGFPPKLFGFKKGETEYTFNALPLGGFVRIWGENKEELESGEENPDPSRAFSARPKLAQATVLLAGIFMNIVLAWFLFTVVLMAGVPTAVDEATASDDAALMVVGALPDSPAAEVLPIGATITAVEADGVVLTTPTPSEFSDFVSEQAPASVLITYRVGDKIEAVTIAPQQGLDREAPQRYLIGTSLSLVETVSRPVHIAIKDGFDTTVNGLVAISVGLYTLLHDAIIGQADFSTVAGPVGIVGMVGDAADFGWTALLSFTAIISLNLAIINLLPFPALDGGRLLFVAIEAMTRKEIPARVAGYTNAAGFMLLLLLMVLVTYQDIMKLL